MDIAEWISQRRKLLEAATAAPWISATGALIGAHAALNAIEEVLDLHYPYTVPCQLHHDDPVDTCPGFWTECAACAEKCPCPTLKAVESALNGSSPRSAQGRACSTCSGGGCPDCTDSPYT